MGDVLLGTTLLASFLGGVVALLAPCCVSVMLPAYLASGFKRRTGIVAGTGVFAAGVATVIVPIGLGAGALARLLTGNHVIVFSTGGTLMIAGGLAMLAGWTPRLPMPAGTGPVGHGWWSIYGLGAFSGIASACCAPVLAGVAVLSGAAASFTASLAVSLTYVAGMVAPLLAVALVWDKRDWGSSRLLHGRRVRLRIGGLQRRIPLGYLLSGVLLAVMGVLTIALAVTRPAMPNSGWQIEVTAQLQHWATNIGKALGFVPGWAVLAALAAAAAYLIWHARHNGPAQHAQPLDSEHDSEPGDASAGDVTTASPVGAHHPSDALPQAPASDHVFIPAQRAATDPREGHRT
jgi:cytochrome c-type biogenesis protein